MADGARRSWKGLATVGLTALAVVVVADLLLHLVAPPNRLREVDDATDEYADADPTVLVLGSSHARTFEVFGEVLAERTGNRERMLAVPVEWGKYKSIQWVLEHRIRPFIEERDANGAVKRPSLRRVLLQTEYWDGCGYAAGEQALNLPARAWELPDFLADVRDNGITAYNRNYLSNRFRRLFSGSSLVMDRGHDRIQMGIQRWLKPPSAEYLEAERQRHIRGWQMAAEQWAGLTDDAEQWAALRSIVAFFRERGVDMTVLIYPIMPCTFSQKALETTLRGFSDLWKARAPELGVRLIDLSTGTPMRDEDYGADFEHMTREGNRKFSLWALDGPLHFLQEDGGTIR